MYTNQQKLLQKYHSMMAQRLSVRAMARMLNLSRSTVRDHIKKIKRDGNLTHGNAGRQNRPGRADKQQIIELVNREYYDFNIAHACEMLAEYHDIIINRETLRRWLDRPSKRRQPKQRQRRPRRANFGEMLQIDGSFHCWFGDQTTCLINIVDDATNTAQMNFDTGETIESACLAAWAWIKQYGVPQSFYADGRNMYHMLEGSKTNFFKEMCRQLGIRVILAKSPQAKGRVERANRTQQDRLIPLLRREGIDNIADANRYLQTYVAKHNARFSVAARWPDGSLGRDVHTKLPVHIRKIDDVCFIEIERVLRADWTFQYDGKTHQVPRQSCYPPTSRKVTIRITISGAIYGWYRGAEFNVR